MKKQQNICQSFRLPNYASLDFFHFNIF